MNQPNSGLSLNIFKVIVTAFQLYRSRFNIFWFTGFQSTIWSLLSSLAIFPVLLLTEPTLISILIFPFILYFGIDSTWIFIILGIIAITLIILHILFSAKGFNQQAVISRIAYQQFINQPEAKKVALEHIKQKFWQFWIAQWLINIRFITIGIATSFLSNIFVSRNSSDVNFITSTEIIFLVIYYGFHLWIAAKYFLADIAIAIENLSATESIRACKTLTKKQIIQILIIVVITWLITLPGYIIAFSPTIAFFSSLLTLKDFSFYSLLSIVGDSILFTGLGIILATIFNIFTIPLWQSIKAVIYHELSYQTR